ncbi:MAG: isocitrate dehydrogenase (NADP(+)) [Candidatus Tectomicrobia bacterium]|nr:isocitrate dehydrogenase (NADP(+)) [Candidatus Tectomicrobia bacterium]
MSGYDKIRLPQKGTKITVRDGRLQVPDDPIVAFIEGDGIGVDITPPSLRVVDAAVRKAYGGKRRVVWWEIYAGEKAHERYGEYLPKDTLEAIQDCIVAIKGPLTTPIGGGFRSLNVAMRQLLNLYACVRPVKWYRGVPSPVIHPEKMDMIIFRENTEDVYAGIEWAQGTPEAKKLIEFLDRELGTKVLPDSGVGIKPISITGSKRLVRKALQWAVARRRKSVTMVHKGNIMKFTEAAFSKWGYELAKEEFRDFIVTEAEVAQGAPRDGKILLNDRIADNMFQQILTRSDEYDILACPNLNGDYLSDACAAQVGGLGMAPGANIGDHTALFEATHGTAPKYAGKNVVNPASFILSAVMMLEYLNWEEAARLIEGGIERTLDEKRVTYDLERQMEGASKVSTSGFAENIIQNL